MKASDSTYGGTTGKSGTDTGAGQNASSKQQESQEVQTAWNNTMNWADSHTHATTGEMVQKFGAELKALGIGVGVGGSLKESAAYTRALTGAALLDAVSRLGAGSGLDSGRKADLMNKGSQMVDEGTKEMSSQDTTLSNSAKQARSFARTASSAYKESQQLSSVVAENRNTSVYVPLNGKSLRQAVGNSNAASTGSQNSEITPVTQKLQALQNAAVPASQALKGIHLTPKETQSLISTSSPQFGRGVQVSTAGAASVHGIPLDSGQVAYVANSKIVNQSIATNTDTYNKLHGQEASTAAKTKASEAKRAATIQRERTKLGNSSQVTTVTGTLLWDGDGGFNPIAIPAELASITEGIMGNKVSPQHAANDFINTPVIRDLTGGTNPGGDSEKTASKDLGLSEAPSKPK